MKDEKKRENEKKLPKYVVRIQFIYYLCRQI